MIIKTRVSSYLICKLLFINISLHRERSEERTSLSMNKIIHMKDQNSILLTN